MNFVLGAVACIYVLFVPGLALSWALFRRASLVERLALSFGLSIAVVPLTVFYTSLVGLPISWVTVVLEVAAITLAAGVMAWRRNRQPKAQELDRVKPVQAPIVQKPEQRPRRIIQF